MKFFSRTSLFVSCLLLLGVGVSVSRSQEGALSANQSSQ